MGRISKNYPNKSTTSEPNHGWDRSPVWRKGKYLECWSRGRACAVVSYLPCPFIRLCNRHTNSNVCLYTSSHTHLHPLTSNYPIEHFSIMSGLLSSLSLYNPCTVDGALLWSATASHSSDSFFFIMLWLLGDKTRREKRRLHFTSYCAFWIKGHDKETTENQDSQGVIIQVQFQKKSYGWVEDKWRKHCASVEPLRNWNSFWPLIELRYVSSLHCISPLCISVCLTLFQLHIKKAICSKKASQHTMHSHLIHKFPLPSIQTRHCPPSHQFSSLILSLSETKWHYKVLFCHRVSFKTENQKVQIKFMKNSFSH